MSDFAEVLSEPTNYAVVQLPGRQFPGVVFQGDTLHSLAHSLNELRQLARHLGNQDMNARLHEVCESLTQVVAHYEAVCRMRGIRLPYPP